LYDILEAITDRQSERAIQPTREPDGFQPNFHLAIVSNAKNDLSDRD
jgi:hypothetical protein